MQVHSYYRKLQENWPCQSIPGHVYMLKTLLVHNIRQQIWQWSFSRVANIKTILWECNLADLKKMLVSVLLPAQPPQKNCHSEGIFFSPKPWQALLTFHQKLYFQTVIQTMLHWLSFEIFFRYYGQHFGLCTIYSKRSIKIWSGLKKKKRATYLLILKLMCRSTANKELFRDGLDCFNWEREKTHAKS